MGTEWGMTKEKGQTGIWTAQGKDCEEWEDTFCPNTGLITRIKNVTNGNESRTKLDYTSEIHRGHNEKLWPARNGDTLLLCGKREKGGNWPLITSFVNLLAKIYCRFLIRNKFRFIFYDETTVSSLGDMLAQPGSRQRNFNEEPSLPFGDAYKKTTRTTAADYGNNRRWRRSCCIIMLAIRNL